MKQKYQHSGKTPPIGVALGLLTGFVASLPLAYLYDYGIINVPFVKLRLIFTVFFGLLVGAATGWGLTIGKVRNGRIAGLIGVVTGLGALYISWAAWLLLIFDKPSTYLFRLLGRPGLIWNLALQVNATGTWSTYGSTTSGVELWIIWLLEALTVVLLALLAAGGMVKKRPFCENCDQWCTEGGKLLFASNIAPADLLARVNQGQSDFLQDATPAAAKQPHYTLAWHSCPTCGALNTLTVSQTLPKNSKVLASQLLLSSGETESLRNWQVGKPALAVAAKT